MPDPPNLVENLVGIRHAPMLVCASFRRNSMELAARCPDDQALDAFVGQVLSTQDGDRIREHLDVCDVCRIGIMAGLSRRHTEPAALGATVDSGMRLGHFELVRRLGAGGMGVVYEAIDERLGRSVALKLLHGEHDESQLLVEARAMARVRHPSVLTVFEVGQYEGSVYLVTELIRGTTLREHVKCTQPALPALFELYACAAEGLAAAHGHGVIHRDFKPDNVLVETGAATRVLVADFGLATAMAPGGHADGSGVAGTPAYMAPEQLHGRLLDARVDVFALCVSLWESVFGARPFAGQTLAEMRVSIHVPPQRPKTPAVPRSVCELLERGLDHDPARRPSLPELIAALRPRRRHKNAIAALVVAGLVAAVAVAAWPRTATRDLGAACRATPTPARTTVGWQQRATAANMPAWVQHRIATTLDAREREVVALQQATCATDDDDARRAWIACRRVHGVEERALAASVSAPWHSYDRLDDALELPWPSGCTSKAARLDAVLDPTDPHEHATLDDARDALARGRLALFSGEPARWRTELERARHAMRGEIDVDAALDEAAFETTLDSRMRVSMLEHAVETAERGGYVTATARAWLSLAIARGTANVDNASIDLAFAQASWSIDRAGDPPMLRARWHAASAARAYQRSDLADAERHAHAAAALAGDDPQRKRIATHALVAAAAARADYAAQRKLLETLLADPATDGGTEALHSSYAECLYHVGELTLARVEIERALAISRATAGDHDPATAKDLVIRGFIELEEGHPEEAVRTTEAAIAILIETVGHDRPAVGSALNLRAAAHAGVDDWKAALADSEAAAAIFDASFGPRSEEAIFARVQIGENARVLHDVARARAAFSQALDNARVTFGPDDPRTADAEAALAAVVAHDVARPLLEHALAVHEHVHTDAPYLAQVQVALAKIISDRSRALALARTALAAWRDKPRWKEEYADIAAWLRRQG